jgi:hypothetical protein
MDREQHSCSKERTGGLLTFNSVVGLHREWHGNETAHCLALPEVPETANLSMWNSISIASLPSTLRI